MATTITPAKSIGLSWQAHAVKAMLRITRRRLIYASASGLMAGIAQTRRAGPARPSSSMFKSLDVQSEQVGPCEVFTLRPRLPRGSGPAVLYLHGGAYCRPITRHHWSFIEWLVAEQACTVIVPLYPLAPESQCVDTLRAVRDVHSLAVGRHGAVDALIGDSAGGGLGLALCQDLRAGDQPLPDRLVLITPCVEATLMHPEIEAGEANDPMLGAAGVREACRLYAGALGVDHPLVSPLRADLHGLPAMQLFVGTEDILHYDALSFASKAAESGCSVELYVAPGMFHVWPLLPIPEAHRARDAIARFLRHQNQSS